MTYDAVVFDNDGVIIEPTDRAVIREAIEDTFAAFGVQSPPSALVERFLDQGTAEDVLEDRYGIDPEAFWNRREHTASQAQVDAVRRGEKTPYDDLSTLSALSSRLGLVSNNQRMTVKYVLDHFDIDHFETAYGREPTLTGAARKKPSPHYLERALGDLEANTALYVGDSNVDIEAAHQAGIDSAFISRPHREDYHLEREPTYEMSTLTDLTDLVESED
jgi:phosphoglycolate phosphatase